MRPASDYPSTERRFPALGIFAEREHLRTVEGLRLGTFVDQIARGFPLTPPEDAAADPEWGFSPRSTDLDARNQYSSPYSSSEIIRRIDVQRCVTVAQSQITPAGVAFELVHWRCPSGAVMVLEDIPTEFDEVVAIGDDGTTPIFTYSNLNGERLCRSELVHPDALVTEPLTWQFFLTYTDDPSRQTATSAPPTAYAGPVPPSAVRGNSITPPWSDARYGSQNRWAENQQFFAPSSTVSRIWVVLRGPVDRFRVRVGARMGGFWQQGGRKGSALAAVHQRRV